MRHATLSGALIGAGLLAAGAAAAQEHACRYDTFPIDQRAFGASRVTPGAPVHLSSTISGCPNATQACRTPPFAEPGDVVLTGRPRGAWICVFRPNKGGGGSTGWIPSNRLTALPLEAAPPLSAWLGRWAYERNRIDIRRDVDNLAAVGHAGWPSVAPDQPHSGGKRSAKFSDEARPSGNRVEFRYRNVQTDNLCVVSLVLVGGFLVAEDNAQCGGRNITFTGVYQRH